MIVATHPYLPKYFSQKGIITFFGIILLSFFLFSANKVSFQDVVFNCVEVIGFFYFLTNVTRKWKDISSKAFQKKLFYTALWIRLIWVLFSFSYFYYMTGKPFEFEAADSIGYHEETKWMLILLQNNKWKEYRDYIGENFSDMGYPIYLGIVYSVFGISIMAARILKALLGTYTVLLVYKLSRNNFGESTGRIAGIMAMLLPNLIYYCGLHVKETEMVFLTVCFVYFADKLLRSTKVSLRGIIFVSMCAAALFFFRTVLAASLIGSLTLAVVLASRRVSSLSRRFVIILLLIIGGLIIYSTPVADNINEYIGASDKNLNSQMDNFATRQDGGNKFAKYGSRGVFLPLILLAPFPTLVDTKQPNAAMLGGAFFTRNVYAFFVFIALLALYRRKEMRTHALLLLVVGSYSFILASSGFALSERFHLPMVPFLLIFAAYGIAEVNQKNKKYYIPYLLFVSILVVGWNWFKLAGRL